MGSSELDQESVRRGEGISEGRGEEKEGGGGWGGAKGGELVGGP